MKRIAPGLAISLGLCVFLCLVRSARAEFNPFAPSFTKLTGGYLWGSLGYRDIRHPEELSLHDRHPFVRAGFAVMFGPFGGVSDTTVAMDSVRTTVEWVQGTPSTPAATRVDTVRTVHSVRSHYTLPGRDGWVSLGVGYQYSGAYRVDIHTDRVALTSTFPMGALYAGAFFGPFPVWHVSRSMFWYVTLGAGIAQLSQANGISDSTLVRFDTERALAPEASLLMGWRLHRGLRLIGGVSVQHVRWSAIRYRAPSESPLSDAALRRLPGTLRLTTAYFNLGVSFDASDLFAR